MTDMVKVITLQPHVERQRRERGDEYMVKAERVPWLINHGFARPAKAVRAEVEVVEAAEAEAAAVEAAAEQSALDEATLDDLMNQWDAKVSPADYLKRWPTGKKVPLAKQIIAKLAQE